MFWEKCNINYIKNSTGEFVKVSGNEVQNNNLYWVYIPKINFDKLKNGIPIDLALENFPTDSKEFLINGIAPKKHSEYTLQNLILQTAFITNSSANSVAFYAMMYLNQKGFSPLQIKKLREKYSLGNLESRYFTIEELRKSFENQSAFFLNLYRKMNENDRFKNFAKKLEQQNRFKEVFKNYENSLSLVQHFNRRIFHTKLECTAMRNDYQEKEFFKNTGVFTEKRIIEKPLLYTMDTAYLLELKMRICKECEGTIKL